jgi:transglutaminase-like putative cysteine protease
VKDALAERPLDPAGTALLVIAVAAAVAPHAWHLPAPVVGLFALAAVYRLLAIARPALLPGRALLGLLLIAGLATVVLAQGALPNRDSGVALLTVMLGLKLLEVRTRRDLFVTVFLGWFVLVTQFLYSQALAFAAYLMLPFLAFLFVLARMHRAEGLAPPLSIGAAVLRLTALALPVTIALFVLFPRLGGPLWGFAVDSDAALTGLSDTLSPGSVSRLVESPETAFRVRFEGDLPPPAQRYWRGPVLWETDGRTWRPGTPVDPPPRIEAAGPPFDYEVTIEPHRRRWLFALDLPVSRPQGAAMTVDHQLLAAKDVEARFTYRVRSVANYRTLGLGPDEEFAALQVPDTVSARVRALAERWRSESPDAAGVVAKGRALFRDEPFVYTLRPPPLGEDPIDAFLFETRRGFCEHYAASFVLLMRLAGVPARIVTGYQGGELNTVGDYLTVRQSDAHAWAEVWLADAGWTRVDPTAEVAPGRIESPIDQGASLAAGRVAFRTDLPWAAAVLRQARWLVDAANLNWHRWVVGYDKERQDFLMKHLGLGGLSPTQLAVLAVAIAGGLLAAFGLWLVLQRPPRRDPVVAAYDRLCRKLARAGVARAPHEGPRDYLTRAAAQLPQAAAQLRAMGRLYEHLRYGRRSPRDAIRQLQRAVRHLSVGATSRLRS